MTDKQTKIIAVHSLTGGAGKSFVAAVLSKILPNTLLADVSFSNMGSRVYAKGTPFRIMEHSIGLRAERYARQCKQHMVCIETCPVGAITADAINPYLCDGCGLCIAACLESALVLTPNVAGRWYYADTEAGLCIDTDQVGARVDDPDFAVTVFEEARKLAFAQKKDYLIVDLASGLTKQNREIMSASDAIILTVQPGVKEVQALKEACVLYKEASLTPLLCINKEDINSDQTMKLIDIGLAHGLKTIGKLPWSDEFMSRLGSSEEEDVSFFGLIPNELKQALVKMMVSLKFMLTEGEK